jgi:hypothetical protein
MSFRNRIFEEYAPYASVSTGTIDRDYDGLDCEKQLARDRARILNLQVFPGTAPDAYRPADWLATRSKTQ